MGHAHVHLGAARSAAHGQDVGQRKGYKVFGLIEYFTGRFFYQGQEGRLNSAAYIAFLTRVLEQTTQPIILIQDGANITRALRPKPSSPSRPPGWRSANCRAYSPDYNPIEKLWKKIKQQETHLHYFPTFEALTEKVEQALLTLPISRKKFSRSAACRPN